LVPCPQGRDCEQQATISNIPIEELVDIMQKERQSLYILGTRRNIPVKLEIKEGNTFVVHRLNGEPSDAPTLNFDSLTSCIEYLRVLGLTIKTLKLILPLLLSEQKRSDKSLNI
jgi:hypothetical protein